MSVHRILDREIAARPEGYRGPNLSPVGLELSARPLSDGVFALLANIPGKDNNGLVVGSEAALVIDAGITAGMARQIQHRAAELTDRPVRYLVNTTYHGDHTFGNAAFPADVTVISSRINKENMAELEYEKQVRSANMYGDAELLDDLTTWRKPDVCFDSYAEIDLGGRLVQLWHFGPGNGPGDTIVYVPDTRTAWTGNYLCHAGTAHMLLQSGPEPYLASLARLREALPDLETIVPGHGPMGSGPDAIDWLAGYLHDLRGRRHRAVRSGSQHRGDAGAVPVPVRRRPRLPARRRTGWLPAAAANAPGRIPRPVSPPAPAQRVHDLPDREWLDRRLSVPPHTRSAGTVRRMLYGRDEELQQVRQLISSARTGRSGALVLRGDAGVGKTALLDTAATFADGMHVLRAYGMESESELPFAALHQLLRPLLPRVDDLPGPQAAALRAAFGLVPEQDGDRLRVALGALTLLSEVSDERPVLCLVDDAQWIDGPTADTLRFVTRRLAANHVAILLTARSDAPSAPELPERRVRGLDATSAAALLAERYPDLVPAVRDQVLGETGGNPLALADLPGALTPGQRAGVEPLLGPLPLPEHLLGAYRQQLRGLRGPTRDLLLVAAAEDQGDLSVVLRASARLGLPDDALVDAEELGLVGVEDTVAGRRIRFRHPLVRAAAYQDSSSGRRREVHRALAEVQESGDDPGPRAWHLAASTTGPDEEVAAELDRGGEVALRRGAPATAATTFERSAWMAAPGASRALRLTRAAEAAYAAGHPTRTATLADQAHQAGADPVTQARIQLLRASVAFDRGSPADAHDLLVTGYRTIVVDHPELAASMLIDAVKNGWFMNDPDRTRAASAALAGVDLPCSSALWPRVRTVLGLGGLVDGAAVGAADPRPTDGGALHALAEAQEPADGSDGSGGHGGRDEPTDILGTILTATSAMVLGDDERAFGAASAGVAGCRSGGRVGWLPLALQMLASAEMLCGRHRFARANATEGLELARALDQDNRVCHFRAVLAWLDAVGGCEESCRAHAGASLRHAESQRIMPTAALASWALGLLDLGLGRVDQAWEHLLPPFASGGHPLLTLMRVPDLAEAAARAGRPDAAAPHLVRFAAWVDEVDRPWARAALLRCEALLSDRREQAEEQYLAALRLYDQIGRTGFPRRFDRARTELLYGEWLRRVRRRADARAPLAAAAEAFDRLGATPWAQRARSELRATGRSLRAPGSPPASAPASSPASTAAAETDADAPPSAASAVASLTPQELQVVRMAAEGASNRDIGAQLFLSPRTVAYHLYKAFPKLGVGSRGELAHVVLEEPAGSEAR